MKFKPALSIALILFVNLMLFLLGYFIVSSTVESDYESAVQKMARLKGDFKKTWHKKTNRDAYKIQQRKIVGLLADMKLRLPDALTEKQLRSSIISRAKSGQVSVTNFEYLSSHPAEFYIQHDMKMALTGTYRDIVRYLYKLQTDKDIIITSSDFSMSVKRNNLVQLDGGFNAYQYITDPDVGTAYEKLREEYRDHDEAR